MPEPHASTAECAIRLAARPDLDALCDLLNACIEDMRAHGIDQWDGDVYPTRATLEADVRAGTAYVAVTAAGDLAGAMVLDDEQNPEYGGVAWTIPAARPAVVHRLMVHPTSRRQGLAKRLMHFAERQAAALGYRVIRLDAFTRNPPALRLYHTLGYRDAGAVTLPKGIFRCFEKQLGERDKEK